MLLGELLRNNNDPERVETTRKTLELFMRLDFLQAEEDLDKVIDDFGSSSDIPSLLAEVNARMVEHLVFILTEYGIVLNPDHNPSLTELYTLVNGIEDLTHYEQPEELLDALEIHEDSVERLVEALSLVVKDMESGNVYDFYNVVESVSDRFWTNLTLVLDGTKEEIVDFDRPAIDERIPQVQGFVWEWITNSRRQGYNLEAAYNFLFDEFVERLGERPSTDLIKEVLLELKTLVRYSSHEDESSEFIMKLFEEFTTDTDVITTASLVVAYVEMHYYVPPKEEG